MCQQHFSPFVVKATSCPIIYTDTIHNRVFHSFHKNDRSDISVLYIGTDASILRDVKILLHAKDLIPDICGQ